ncbi:hypothetical protein Tco_0328634 [Tanacetum coccineum]
MSVPLRHATLSPFTGATPHHPPPPPLPSSSPQHHCYHLIHTETTHSSRLPHLRTTGCHNRRCPTHLYHQPKPPLTHRCHHHRAPHKGAFDSRCHPSTAAVTPPSPSSRHPDATTLSPLHHHHILIIVIISSPSPHRNHHHRHPRCPPPQPRRHHHNSHPRGCVWL